ncbi:GNAT family N-acetyltransferase [Streptomyces sp. 049-1]|uniref:GNAT family N-acetyltransferase n=1 Tax=Streptomyces sp. 049-1 TaxID=2789264 RepID=UPI00397EBE0A
MRFGGQAAGPLVYETAGSRRVLTHTTIRADYRGRGWSKLLIRHALDDLAANGATISNYCEVVDRFIEENPEYARLINLSHPGGRGHMEATMTSMDDHPDFDDSGASNPLGSQEG